MPYAPTNCYPKNCAITMGEDFCLYCKVAESDNITGVTFIIYSQETDKEIVRYSNINGVKNGDCEICDVPIYGWTDNNMAWCKPNIALNSNCYWRAILKDNRNDIWLVDGNSATYSSYYYKIPASESITSDIDLFYNGQECEFYTTGGRDNTYFNENFKVTDNASGDSISVKQINTTNRQVTLNQIKNDSKININGIDYTINNASCDDHVFTLTLDSSLSSTITSGTIVTVYKDKQLLKIKNTSSTVVGYTPVDYSINGYLNVCGNYLQYERYTTKGWISFQKPNDFQFSLGTSILRLKDTLSSTVIDVKPNKITDENNIITLDFDLPGKNIAYSSGGTAYIKYTLPTETEAGISESGSDYVIAIKNQTDPTQIGSYRLRGISHSNYKIEGDNLSAGDHRFLINDEIISLTIDSNMKITNDSGRFYAIQNTIMPTQIQLINNQHSNPNYKITTNSISSSYNYFSVEQLPNITITKTNPLQSNSSESIEELYASVMSFKGALSIDRIQKTFWRVYEGATSNLVYTSDDDYNSLEPELTYDGFKENTSYSIELILKTENNSEYSQRYEFTTGTFQTKEGASVSAENYEEYIKVTPTNSADSFILKKIKNDETVDVTRLISCDYIKDYNTGINETVQYELIPVDAHSNYVATELAAELFKNDTNLVSITVPEGITKIGNGCFEGCTSLTTIKLPNSLTHIGDTCFKNCTKLQNINLEDTSITSIPIGCFNISDEGFTPDENRLTSITLPPTVTTIGNTNISGSSNEDVFYANDSHLFTIYFNYNFPATNGTDESSTHFIYMENNQYIDAYSPYLATGAGDNATLDYKLFKGKDGNEYWNYGNTLRYSGVVTTYNLWWGLYGPADATNNLRLKFSTTNPTTNNTNDTEITIPSTFYGLANIQSYLDKISIIDLTNVISICDNFATGMTNMTSVINVDLLQTIGKNAFVGTNLTSFNIKSAVTTIGEDAFNVDTITSFTVYNAIFSYSNNQLIESTTRLIKDLNNYAANAEVDISSYNTIDSHAFKYPDSIRKLVNTTTKIPSNYGIKNLIEYKGSMVNLTGNKKTIKKLILTNESTLLVLNISNDNIDESGCELIFHRDLTSSIEIRKRFAAGLNITKITTTNVSVKNIGTSAFESCTMLKEVYINVTSNNEIGCSTDSYRIFYGCTALKNCIFIGGGNKSLNSYTKAYVYCFEMLYNCESIQKIQLPHKICMIRGEPGPNTSKEYNNSFFYIYSLNDTSQKCIYIPSKISQDNSDNYKVNGEYITYVKDDLTIYNYDNDNHQSFYQLGTDSHLKETEGSFSSIMSLYGNQNKILSFENNPYQLLTSSILLTSVEEPTISNSLPYTQDINIPNYDFRYSTTGVIYERLTNESNIIIQNTFTLPSIYYKPVYSPQITTSDWQDVTIFGTTSKYNCSKDNIYEYNGERWDFTLDVDCQTISVNQKPQIIENANAIYPSFNFNKTNYLSQQIKTKIGNLRDYEYVGDNLAALKRFIKFAADDTIKVIRLKNGMCIPCIIQMTSIDTNYSVVNPPTDISFTWTQVGSADNLSLIEMGYN